jgi:hypothetical protein
MKYLEPEFIDYLNAAGLVEIEGYTFERARILRGLDEEVYRTLFQDWLEQRRKDQLQKADDILSRFPENRARFLTLQALIARETVIPFVGAGLSIPSGYPGWTQFLWTLLPETKIPKEELDTLVSTGQYEVAADRIHQNMPNGAFFEAIENHYSLSKNLCGPVQQLPNLFTQYVVTTNFDDVLERCYSEVEIPFEEILLGPDASETPRLIGQGKRVLIKLHGKSSTSRNRVLTKTEYDAHYAAGTTLESVIETIASKTMLFLGCSLTVDRTIQTLANIVHRKGAETMPRHYAFLPMEKDGDRVSRRDELTPANIYPIWYPADDDPSECIESLLTKLEEGMSQ